MNKPRVPAAPHIEEFLEEFRAHLVFLRRAPQTRRHYLGTARRFFREFPQLQLRMVTAEHLERYLGGRSLSAASVRTELEVLRAFFAWVVKRKGELRTNPCDAVEHPQIPQRLRPAPTLADFQVLRAVCRTLEEAVLVELFYFTGLRLNELRLLRWPDVDLTQRRIRLVGKGSKERVVIFPLRVAALLQEASSRGDPYGFLVPERYGPWGEMRIERTLRRLGLEAGLPYKVTPHILRHGFVRLMKTQGVPVEVTARLAGHSSIQTTVQLYGRLDENDLQAIYDKHLLEVADGRTG